MPEIIIRPAIEQDAHDIVRFIRALAVFEREHVEAVKISEQDVSRDGFGPAPRFDALIAEVDGSAVGFALFFPTYSTWEGSAGIHLEDIYVDEHARSLGVGRRLMVALAEIAVERDCAALTKSKAEESDKWQKQEVFLIGKIRENEQQLGELMRAAGN